MKIKVKSPDGKTLKVTVKLPKRRAIFLFEKDTPFKPKVVKNKKTFKRREKHQRKDHE